MIVLYCMALVHCTAGVLFHCIAPTKRHFQCAEVALSCGADYNNATRQGTPVLTFACETAKSNEDLCLALLDAGADPTATDEVLCRPRHFIIIIRFISCTLEARSHTSCASLRCASKNAQEAFLPAHHSNAQHSVCLNATLRLVHSR